MKVAIPIPKGVRPSGIARRRFSGKSSLLLLAAAIISMAAGYQGYRQITAGTKPAVAPQTATARLGSLITTVSTTGSVVSTKQAKLSFQSAGRLVELNVGVGDSVKTGQQIGKVDPQPLQIKVAQAESTLKTNQIKLNQLMDVATPQEIAAAQAAFDAAQAKYREIAAGVTNADRQSAQASVDSARSNLATAEAKLAQVQAGYTNADLVSAQSSVDSAKSSLSSAQAKLEQVKAGSTQAEWASAQKDVDSAKANLATAQAKLAQVKAGPLQSEITAQRARVDSAKSTLISAEDRYQNILNNDRDSDNQYTSGSAALRNFDAAKTDYDSAVQKLNEMLAGPTAVDLLTAQTSVDTAQATLSSALAKIEEMKKGPTNADLAAAQSSVDSAKANLSSAQAKLEQVKAGSTEADLISAQTSVDTARSNLASAEAKLEDVLAGPKASEVQSARSSMASAESTLALKTSPPKETDLALAMEQIRQSEVALDQAKLDLANAVLLAPFAGVISAVTPNVGEQVGASSAVVTLVDPSAVRIDVTVDEMDVAKLALGQTAAVTFDALPDKRLNGKVIAVSPSGTTSQGVVSYLVSVNAETGGQILPSGMTAAVTVETDRKDNVLLVPNRAIRTQGRNKTVEVLVGEKSETRTVQTGASNDQMTQITTGLEEGETVVIPVTTTAAPRGGVAGPVAAPTKR